MKRGKKSKQEKIMTGLKGKKNLKGAHETKSMMGRVPFDMQPKKPEPDDRPRPARPPSTNKNAKSQNSTRVKRLTGVLI